MFGGQDNDDENDEPMESSYHQDGEKEEDEEEEGEENETEIASRADESYNLADNYSYDKWLQEQDPILIEKNVCKLKEMFPVSKGHFRLGVLISEVCHLGSLVTNSKRGPVKYFSSGSLILVCK